MLPYATLRKALAERPLFEAKTWRLSPSPWPLTPEQAGELEQIGRACLDFHQALDTLYLRSAAGKNLLRNRQLHAPWAAAYLDRGKPPGLIAHARDARLRGIPPPVIRPDLLLTSEGFVLTELDSVPGGIGLTAFLNRLYERGGRASAHPVVGAGDAMLENFWRMLSAHAPGRRSPVAAIVVSDEAATYRPEMAWLAEELQRLGRRVFCLHPREVFPLGGAVYFDAGGAPEKIDIIYRFFELFDLPSIPSATFMMEAWSNGELALVPPFRPFHEEKLGLALFTHPRLGEFWEEHMEASSLGLLRRIIPPSWIIDPAPLPPGAVLDGPLVGGRPMHDWRQLGQASQKERELVLKISGFHETAWGARGVLLGSDCARGEWNRGVEEAIALAPTHPHILQEYRKPCRLHHPLYDEAGAVSDAEGRLRLCPYYFVVDGEPLLSGALATFCPPDKKIIHGMQDAALMPCAAPAGPEGRKTEG